MSIEICLSTLNASYPHAAFGLRYLKANLGSLEESCLIKEYTINKKTQDIADELLALNPKILGFGVYIWNTDQTKAVIEILKAQKPDILIVLGGPEVSYESEGQKIVQLADYVICGEADFLFRDFCEQILKTKQAPAQKIIRGSPPEISQIKSPYLLYDDNDIKNRVIYVEASRGCPYKCEYCLSSLDKSVRNFPIELFLAEMEMLFSKGVRQFKFIDRTFNLSPKISTQILIFFLEKSKALSEKEENLFLHFEMVPDRLPDELKNLICQFPAGSLQFEIGIQTWDANVAALVSRRQDFSKVEENLTFLRQKTKVHTHVDLIAGLPSEDLETFARGFDRLANLDADEIQVGVLKRLKGAPIIHHDFVWQMKYDPAPPFQILSTKTMDAKVIAKVTKFSKFWDLISNRGQFKKTCQFIRNHCLENKESLFYFYWNLTDYLIEQHQKSHSIHLTDLFRSMHSYLTTKGFPATELLFEDYHRTERYHTPDFLRNVENFKLRKEAGPSSEHSKATPKRQSQHLQKK